MRLATAMLAFTFLVGACGKKKEVKTPDPELLGEIAAQFDDYLKWSRELLAPRNGWVTGGCDDTLFTGLRSQYDDVDLTAALLEPGKWERRSLRLFKPCHTTLDPVTKKPLSKSSGSRDQLIGVAVYIQKHGRSDLARDVLDYANRNNGHIGDGDAFRTEIRLPLYATFLKLAGRDDIRQHAPVAVGGELGYQRHIAAWHLITRADVEGGMREGYKTWIEGQATSQPHNPLHQWTKAAYVTGDFRATIMALQDTRYYPRDRLPSSLEVCDEWPMQRDMGHNWEPCLNDDGTPAQFEQYSGSDWLAIAWRMLHAAGLR